MKKRNTLLCVIALLAIAASAQAASHGGAPMTSETKADTATKAATDMAEGEIRKVDVDNKKITIKHGVTKNLDMPGMTMVFHVKEDALLGKVKIGDKVRFSAEQSGSALVVTAIEVTQ